jgi:adenine-specific DNA-methyltransferase
MSFNYIGSKRTLVNFILNPIKNIISQLNKSADKIRFLDGFAGTGVIGSTVFRETGINVYANDLEYYSYIINYSLLCVSYNDNIKRVINEINRQLDDGINKDDIPDTLITDNYTLGGEEERMFWTEENGLRCDYSINKIKQLLDEGEISHDEYKFILASIMLAMDKVANTTSVYGAYLKSFKSTAQEQMKVIPIHTFEFSGNNKAYNVDINTPKLLAKEYDIVYLDPPYNERQYSANYHPLNYIAQYTNLEIYGKTGLIKGYNKSSYCKKSEAIESLEHLISNLNARYILLSYNNEGIMDFENIKELLLNYGSVTLYKKLYKKYKSSKKETKKDNNNVYEFLFCLEKLPKDDKVSIYDEILIE